MTRILAREGETVGVGSLLAEIDSSKTDGAASKPTVGNGAGQRRAAAPATPPRRRFRAGEGVADAPARRVAERLGVDLARVRGSGPNGLILRSDVEKQAQAHSACGGQRRCVTAGSGRREARTPCADRRPRSPATWNRASRFQPRRVFAAWRSTCSMRGGGNSTARSAPRVAPSGSHSRTLSPTRLARAAARDAVHHALVSPRRFRRAGAIGAGNTSRPRRRHRTQGRYAQFSRAGHSRCRRARLRGVSCEVRRARRKGA